VLPPQVLVEIDRRAGGEAGKEADDHDGNAELQAVVSREQVFNLLECE
jgi:hypothetical protein